MSSYVMEFKYLLLWGGNQKKKNSVKYSEVELQKMKTYREEELKTEEEQKT